MNLDKVVVDIHSHVFNAQDLPIAGFLATRVPVVPRVLSRLVMELVERVRDWLDTNDFSEIPLLLKVINGEEFPDDSFKRIMLDASDEEAIQMLGKALQETTSPGMKFSDRSFDNATIVELVAKLSASEQHELEEWVEEYSEDFVQKSIAVQPFSWAKDLVSVVARLISMFRLVANPRYRVANKLASTYPEVMLYVPALVDFEVPAADDTKEKYPDQIAVHSLLSKVSMLNRLNHGRKVRLHPFVGFDPFREMKEHSSLQMVRVAIETLGFIGVKIYPPTGFRPIGNEKYYGRFKGKELDEVLDKLYTYCTSNDVPILTHANDSNEFGRGWGEFAGPAGWADVLAIYPKLRVCFGHFGHLTGTGDPPDDTPSSWAWQFIKLTDVYENVYADVGNSKFLHSQKYRDKYLLLLKKFFEDPQHGGRRKKRLMYGSDWWMNLLHPRHEESVRCFSEHYQKYFQKEATQDFMAGNALRYLGFIQGEHNDPDLNNANRRRLQAFYGSIEPPFWLKDLDSGR